MGDQSFICPKWSRNALSGLHPLFALHLDILHIHLSSDRCSQLNLPQHESLTEELDLQDTMRSLLRGIVSVIDYRNVYILHADVAATDEKGLEKLFQRNTEESLARYSVAPNNIKRICLSWDLGPVPDRPINLVGRRFERLDPPTDAENNAARYGWKKFVKYDCSKPQQRVHVTGYYLRDADYLAGEVGIISPSWWGLSEPIWLHVTCLVDNVRRMGCVISSRGLGTKCNVGQRLVRKKDFDEVERIVSAERARVQEERKADELWMAYDMEGVTID